MTGFVVQGHIWWQFSIFKVFVKYMFLQFQGYFIRHILNYTEYNP